MNKLLKQQRGAVLVVCMIILLMLTLLGLSGARSIILQEKMTFASRDAQLALQTAEAALRAAEANIRALSSVSGFGAVAGNYSGGKAPADLLDGDTWKLSGSRHIEVKIDLKAGKQKVLKPQYFIELAGELSPPASAPEEFGGNPGPDEVPVTVFRVVARGVGLGGTERILITHFGKKFL